MSGLGTAHMKPWKLIVLRLLLACLFGCAIMALALSAGQSEAAHSVLETRQIITRYTLTQINKAMADYRLTHHTLPRSLSQLKTEAGDRDYSQNPDGWGHPFIYTVQGTRFLVVSYGRDGKPGGTGWDTDLTSDNPHPPNDGLTFRQFLTYLETQDLVQWACISGVLASLLCWFTVRPQMLTWRDAPGLAGQILVALVAAAVIALAITVLHLPSGH